MKHRNQGSVLMITLAVLIVGVVLVGIVLSTTMTVSRNTYRSRNYLAGQSAADGAVEYAYAIWLKRTNNKHGKLFTTADLAVTGPIFTGSTFTASSVPAGTNEFSYDLNSPLSILPLNKFGVAVPGSRPDGVIGSVPGYPGWWGTTYTYAATARMRQPNGATFSVGARRLFYYTEVSMFQTMFFFNDDLEIYNPAPIILTGLIHTNKALYLSVDTSLNLKVNGHASTAGTLPLGYTPDFGTRVPGFSSAEPPLAKKSNYDYGELKDPTWNNGGAGAQLNQIAAIQPLGTALDSLFAASSSSTNPNLKNGYHELIEPPDLSNLTTNPDPISEKRLFNKAGLLIKVTGTNRSGTIKNLPGNIKIKQYTAADIGITTATVDPSTKETTINDIPGFPIQVAASNGASLPTFNAAPGATQSPAYNAATADLAKALSKQLGADQSSLTKLHDDRVGKNVNVVNVDVGNLNAFITKDLTGNFNGVLYVYDNTVDSNYNNTVRLQNGQVLPSTGLTVASQNPVYIQGDYNTGFNAPSSSTPAAIDNATKLPYGSLEYITANGGTKVPINTGNTTSAANAPAYTRVLAAVVGDAIMLLSNAWSDVNSTDYDKRDASHTTFNTALLGGYMPSQSGNFSGGAINYPRFLENWKDKGCVYWGSMVELFPSKIFTQLWQEPGNYYYPPDRYFNFDPNFLKNPPPGSVAAIVLSRGPWSKF